MTNYLSLFTVKTFDLSNWTGLQAFSCKGEISQAAKVGTLILVFLF